MQNKLPSPSELPRQVPEEFSPYIFDDTVRYEQPRFLFEYRAPGKENPVGFGPLGGIQALSGQQKHGKSIFATLLIAAILANGKETGRMAERFPGFRVRQSTVSKLKHEPSVLYVDTEQERENTSQVVERAKWLAEWPPYTPHPRLHVVWTKVLASGKNNPYRWEIIKWAVEFYKPDLVIIDGIRDIISNFNDLEESAEILNEIGSMATLRDISIWNTLHLNPSGDSSNKMRGHLGTELSHKCTDTFVVKKSKDASGDYIFTVSQTDARGKDVPDMIIELNDDADNVIPDLGAPKFKDASTAAVMSAEYKEQQRKQELCDIFQPFNWPKKGSTFTALRAYLNNLGYASNTKVYNILDEAVECGVLVRNDAKKYFFKGMTSTESDDPLPKPTNQELEF